MSTALVGQAVARREDERILRGQGRYLDDIELPRETRDATPPAMEEGPDSPLSKRRRKRARELGVPEHR